MYRNISLPTMITLWILITGAGIFKNIEAFLRAKESGKICFRLFSRRSNPIVTVVLLLTALLSMLSAMGISDSQTSDVFLTAMFLLEIAVWLPLVTGFYITRKGILYADNRRESESFTARDYNGRIGIFAEYDLRTPVCTVEDTPENRELLADFWRELPARKENQYRDKILAVLEKWDIEFEDFNIDFSLPFLCQRSNLNEDLVQAKLGSYLADIGWYPEADPRGKLRLRLIENFDWQRPLAEYDDNDFDELEKHLSEISKRVEDFYL